MTGLSDIRRAAELLAGKIMRTPCLRSATLSDMLGADIWIKFENLQFTAAFKERGARVKLESLTAAERQAGVIAVSAGNHAQGVARHAALLGIKSTIVMPKSTPFSKVRATEALGATILLEGDTLAEAAAATAKLASERGYIFIHPYDDDLIIAGQGTVAIEMLDDVPGLDALIVPVGGGGLISGMAIAAKAMKPGIEVVGVETELYPSLARHFHPEVPQPEGDGDSIAEGIAVRQVGTRNLEICRRLVDDTITVRESEIEQAIMLYLEIEKTVSEGAGAAPLAAVLANPARFHNRRIGLVLCGGNIDPRLLASVLQRGLVRQGRLTRLRIGLSDKPGMLARVTGLIGECGANIIEVSHQRLSGAIGPKAVELDVLVETRDAGHAERLLQSLTAAGFAASRTDQGA